MKEVTMDELRTRSLYLTGYLEFLIELLLLEELSDEDSWKMGVHKLVA